MTTGTISLAVDADAAQAFAAAPLEDRRKLEVLLRLRLRELTSSHHRPLRQIMDEIGAEAVAKGMTPELLEAILRGE